MPLQIVDWGKELFDTYPNYPMACLVGGRGRGASELAARIAIRAMLEFGDNVLIGREHQKSIKDSNINLIKKIIRESEYSRYFNLSIKTEIKCLQSGAICGFKGIRLNMDDWRSLSDYQLIILEEAHDMTDEQLDVILPSLRDEGITIIALWNPQFADSPIERLRTYPGAKVEFHTYEDNNFKNESLATHTQWDKDNRPNEITNWKWEGGFKPQDESAMYPYWLVDDAYGNDFDDDDLLDDRIAGLDIAGSESGDYTSLHIQDLEGREVHADRIQEPDLHKRVTWAHTKLTKYGCSLVLVDCTGGRGQAETEALIELGITAQPFIFTRSSKPAILNNLHMSLSNRELSLRNETLKAELKDLGETGKALTKNDDMVMALGMAELLRQDGGYVASIDWER